jgi:hypothetical protein
MKFCYADPPYIGQAKRHYQCDEIDHGEMISRLCSEFPDGWALSASSPSLRFILPLCPNDIRIGAWVKSFCAFKKGVRPAYAWEPVIFRGGRNPSNGFRHIPPEKNGKQTTPKDFIVEPITLKKGLVGAKPAKVCRWILDLLNVQPGDEVVDLFPGTGIMGIVAEEVTGNGIGGDEPSCDHGKLLWSETCDECIAGQWAISDAIGKIPMV